MNRKSLVMSIISTFCLTSIIFLIIPVHSYTPYTYNPWLDVNDDGKINLIDTFSTDLAYGTTGDPTKPVTVTNWPQGYSLSQSPGPSNVTWTNYGVSTTTVYEHFVSGYSRACIILDIVNMSDGIYSLNVTLYSVDWYSTNAPPFNGYIETMPVGTNVFVIHHFTGSPPWWYTNGLNIVPLETKAPYAEFSFNIYSDVPSGWILFSYEIYLRNE